MAKVKVELDDIQEDLKQAIDILKEQVEKSHQSGNAMFFKEAIEGISEFDGSTVPIKKWLQEIDDNAIIFGWTDLHTLVVAKKLLTGVAKLWLRSQPTFSTWPELKEAITNKFYNPIDSRNIHILLTKRKKQQFESYYEYFLNMRKLGSQGNLEETQVQTKPHDEKQNYLAETTQKGRMFKGIKINDHELQALIDTGSQLNLIRFDWYLALGSPSFDADDRFISGIGNKRVKLLGKFKAEVKIDDVLFVTIFNIVPEDSMKVVVIIGDEMLKEVHFSVVDQIDKLQAARPFSTIDLKNGFFHIPVAEDSRKLTSFVGPNGQYEFLKTPFGLCNAPAKFQRFINSIFAEEIQKGIVLTYLDDILTEEYGLQINWEKCQILKSEITYLGHEIKDGVIRPSDDKVAAVKRFPELKTIKQLQSFLGLTGYFRKFIKKLFHNSKTPFDMLNTNANFMMGPDQKQAFQDLKHILTTSLDLEQFSSKKMLIKKMHPVHYMSKKTNEAQQQKYSSYELEVLAVVKAVKKFRVYLLGIKFKILTDCSAFTMTLKKKDLTTRVARWALLLEEYDYTIEHRPGSGMKHVDVLSRNPVSMMIQTDTHTLVEKIRNAQGRDPLIKALLVIVKEKLVYDGNFEENNLLWKEVEGNRTLVIPKGMEIIKLAHEERHFGVQKNFEMLKKEYYITYLKRKIKKYIQNCIPCILSNRKHGKQEGMLHPISKEESIEHCCITTGVPRGNGQLERINRTIVSVLTKLSIDNPQEWHKHVRKLQKALNSTHQRSIRMSPFELLVGVKMRKEDLRLLEMIEDLALTFDEERDQKRKAAKQEILKIQEENRNTFNKKRKKPFVYKEGDLVVIQKPQFATKSKLYRKYIGPYKVIKIKPNDRYNVEKFANFEGPNRTSCSADLMKPWFTQDEYPSELSEADEVQDGQM
ncbi:hypothetical protein LAZ67_12000184 [Cordylochernes scorpioides]|uniref:RNA-directed DNA polymerase n=1 Tax=Cordylochernes scorpioides TaxID=51811 RepID=A0ABY6L0B5_9ARAC|nr:hypothetical protein LAZ67_12000184 [Cordylochernes scorpioides]